jgi:hypothetical protein
VTSSKTAVALLAAAVVLLAAASAAQGRPSGPRPGAHLVGTATPEATAARAGRFAARHSALGSYFDAVKKQQVVVVPRRSAVTGSQVARAVGAHSRVERRSITLATVESIQRRVAGRAFGAAAGDYTYASYLDLASGKVVLRTDAPRTVTAALAKEYPGVIDLRPGGPQDDLSREADLAPFWGGGSITSDGGICSAGFTVENSAGARFMVTAGHCFPLGGTVLTTHGDAGVGSVVERGPIPPFDMELIGGRFYGPSIYVGDTASWSRRRVTGAADPVVGFSGYCRSGRTTGERCGQTVTSVNAQVCTQTGCKSPVIVYDGGVAGAAAPGDSGAPLYVPGTDGKTLQIRGMHIAAGGTTSYAEKWSRISSHLGVTIVAAA